MLSATEVLKFPTCFFPLPWIWFESRTRKIIGERSSPADFNNACGGVCVCKICLTRREFHSYSGSSMGKSHCEFEISAQLYSALVELGDVLRPLLQIIEDSYFSILSLFL